MCLFLSLTEIRIKTDDTQLARMPIAMLEKALGEPETSAYPLHTIDTNADTPYNAYQEIRYIESETDSSENLPVGTIIFSIYIIGLAVNLIIVSRSVYSMANVIRRGRKQSHMNYTLVLVPEDIIPFSWGKYIVLSESDYKNNPDEIITHEMAHARHYHSVDIIMMELVVLFQWFNPAVWLLKRELKDVHEYQADISVLKSGVDATKYQLLLVKKAVGASSYTLANSFNHSKIKKRITMMLKVRSNRWARLKLLLMLPLATLTAFAFARPEVNEPLGSLVKYESTTILPKAKIPKKEVIKFTPPVIKPDTVVPQRTVKFTPPQVKKDNAKSDTTSKRTVKFTPPQVKKKSTPPPPPPLSKKKVSEKNNEVIVVEDIEGKKATRKTSPPPPPPLPKKKVSERNDKVTVVEDVEGKKAAEKKATPPPPPPMKKNDTKVIIKDEVEIEEVVVVGSGSNKKTTTEKDTK
jgi:hypothetical protein